MLQFQYQEEPGDEEIAIVEKGNPGRMAKSTQETHQKLRKKGEEVNSSTQESEKDACLHGGTTELRPRECSQQGMKQPEKVKKAKMLITQDLPQKEEIQMKEPERYQIKPNFLPTMQQDAMNPEQFNEVLTHLHLLPPSYQKAAQASQAL